MHQLSTFIWATLEPIASPILKLFADALNAATDSVVNRNQLHEELFQDEFDNPSHSVLAKDHLDHILNGPAGMMSQILFRRCVNAVANAWNDSSVDAEQVANEVCTLIHHPFFADPKNEGQKEMLNYIETWLERQGDEKEEVLSRRAFLSLVFLV